MTTNDTRHRPTALAPPQDDPVARAIWQAADAAGFIDPGDAVALIDREAIRVDAAGDGVGVVGAVRALARERPYLLGNPEQRRRGALWGRLGDQGAPYRGGPAAGAISTDMNALIRGGTRRGKSERRHQA